MNNGKRITAFFLILLCLTFLSSGLFYRAAKKTQDPSLLRRNAAFMDLEKEPRESIDLLVLGDSESYTSISPMQVYNETGITTYVAGQSGQNMAEMYHMFETAMKTQTPKAIMIAQSLERTPCGRERQGKRMEGIPGKERRPRLPRYKEIYETDGSYPDGSFRQPGNL